MVPTILIRPGRRGGPGSDRPGARTGPG